MVQATPIPLRRSRIKHRAILEAAARLVERSGYAAASIEAVAREAGSGKQTIYRWWPSKAALFVEVYGDLISRDVLLGDEPNARERLHGVLARLFALYRRTPAGAILAGLIGEATSDKTAREALIAGLVLGRAEIVTGLVEHGNATSEFSVSAKIVHEVVIALVWKRLVVAPETLNDSFAAELTELALAAGRHETLQ
jgi:AcrR family transcriptional regulator